MNNKTVIEFGFRIIWRIMEISEGVIRLDLRPWRVTLSSISIILHKILSLIHWLLNVTPSPHWMAYSTRPELTPVFRLAARTLTGILGDIFCPQTLTQSLTPKTHVNSDWVRVCFARYRSLPLPQWKKQQTIKQNNFSQINIWKSFKK